MNKHIEILIDIFIFLKKNDTLESSVKYCYNNYTNVLECKMENTLEFSESNMAKIQLLPSDLINVIRV